MFFMFFFMFFHVFFSCFLYVFFFPDDVSGVFSGRSLVPDSGPQVASGACGVSRGALVARLPP
jgi:asparagine N-glycosylation enzyme membrane subunit Stt3